MSGPIPLPGAGPFDLHNHTAYGRWREHKLEARPASVEELIVEVHDPRALTGAEHEALLQRCRRANMAVYAGNTGSNPHKAIPKALGEQFGLEHLDRNTGADDDAITPLSVSHAPGRAEYVPYSNRPLHWHTDGYYNDADHQVRALVLHCVHPAAEGGVNRLLDPEIAYIMLRDTDPELVQALMHPRAMTLPANVVDGRELRPERAGPVFSVDRDDRLHMRYTARLRHVRWLEDPAVRAAAETLDRILTSPEAGVFQARLKAGWGLLCNNVLHDRSGFTDHPDRPRLLYRARYYERIAGT